MEKVKISTVTNRSYYRATTYRKYYLKGHKKYEQSLIINVENADGKIYFELVDVKAKTSERLDNPVTGTYTFPLKSGVRYAFIIRTEAAKGGYKVQKQTIKNPS